MANNVDSYVLGGIFGSAAGPSYDYWEQRRWHEMVKQQQAAYEAMTGSQISQQAPPVSKPVSKPESNPLLLLTGEDE